MYAVYIQSNGKYENVTDGIRIMIGKNTMENFRKLLEEMDCKFTIYQLFRLHGLFFGSRPIYHSK